VSLTDPDPPRLLRRSRPRRVTWWQPGCVNPNSPQIFEARPGYRRRHGPQTDAPTLRRASAGSHRAPLRKPFHHNDQQPPAGGMGHISVTCPPPGPSWIASFITPRSLPAPGKLSRQGSAGNQAGKQEKPEGQRTCDRRTGEPDGSLFASARFTLLRRDYGKDSLFAKNRPP